MNISLGRPAAAMTGPDDYAGTEDVGGGAVPDSHPTIIIDGDAADQIAAGRRPGDTFTANVTFEVVAAEAGSVELKATEFEPAEAEAAPEGEVSADAAADEFMAGR